MIQKTRIRIASPISTMKSASEAIMQLLGHKIGPWELRGTKTAPVYFARCMANKCIEKILIHRNNSKWASMMPMENIKEEIINYSMTFNKVTFSFNISPRDNTGSTITRSGRCNIERYFRQAVLNLNHEYFCAKIRNFK